jgi:hypothetical protein
VDVIDVLGRAADDITATRQPNPEPVPVWLVDRLVRVARMQRDDVVAMSPEDAMAAWETFITRPPT